MPPVAQSCSACSSTAKEAGAQQRAIAQGFVEHPPALFQADLLDLVDRLVGARSREVTHDWPPVVSLPRSL